MVNGAATNCVFTGNTASNGGGGGGMAGGTATNCVFTDNIASRGDGGGMVYGAATNCAFTRNSATDGGGIYGSTTTNCVLTSNSASNNGGGAYSASLYFCTVASNYATQSCGGVYTNSISNNVINCIVYGNTSGRSVADINGNGNVRYSDARGGISGIGNINADPLFVNMASGNLHLLARSPCINVGSVTAPPSIFTFPTTDLDGGKRAIGIAPDMGAYEVGNVGVFGAIAFDGVAVNAPMQNVTFQFRPTNGGAAINQTYFTTSDGAFYLYGVPDGNYNVWVKSPTYLAAVVPVTVVNGAVSGIVATLEPGDANNDNSCDATDFGLFVSAYNTSASVPRSGYDPTCDFNGDGLIDDTDFALFVGSYNTQGDL